MKCETGSKSQYITDDNTDGRYTEMKISNIKVVKNTGADKELIVKNLCRKKSTRTFLLPNQT